MSSPFRPVRRAGALGLLSSALALTAGCSLFDTDRKIEKPPPQRVTGEGANVSVDDTQSGSPVELRADQTLTVRLRLAGTATAEWTLIDFVPGALTEIGKPRFEQDPVAARYGEVGGLQTWRFAAAKPGPVTLRFELRPPRSLAPASAVATYAVTVR